MKAAVRIAIVLLLAAAPMAQAQGFKVNGMTTARYMQLRPIDTSETVSLVPFTQDLQFNFWGLGTGVRLYGELRARASAGDGAHVWPQAEDNFDVVAAFAELDRPLLRARVGRQFKTSPLGFYNFDGASLLFRPARVLSAEVYGGWSLIPGESEEFTDDVIAGIEPYAPDVARQLVGGEVKVRFGPRAAFSALYQREIRDDRAGLYAERAAADLAVRAGRISIDGGIEADVAGEVVNEARLRVSLPIAQSFSTVLEARRYRPYFDLWTIWGAFNPIGFSEVLATAGWQTDNAALRVGGGLRRYGDDDGGVEFDRLRDDGWRVLADASWTPKPIVTFTGGYRADIGFGASRSQGDVGARINLGESSYIGASSLAFQMINELQVADGTVYGLGSDASFKLPGDTRLGWNFAIYRHEDRNASIAGNNWNQLRGSLFVAWTVGSNPDEKRLARTK